MRNLENARKEFHGRWQNDADCRFRNNNINRRIMRANKGNRRLECMHKTENTNNA